MSDGAHEVGEGLAYLSEFCSQLEARTEQGSSTALLDSTIRCCLLCVALGLLDDSPVLEGLAVGPSLEPPQNVSQAMGRALQHAALGAAADLDPMSVGPAHVALTATVAACVSGQLSGKTTDEDIANAVLAGIEAGSRLRDAVQGGRPGGSGFHSSGTFGTIAAAASAARLLNLPPAQFANAIGIAFTRMSGLALNAAFTRICLTHFGWAAAHGIEAAYLAGSGWEASHNVSIALGSLFPGCSIDIQKLESFGPGLMFAPETILFKRYPCNAYLNAVVNGLKGLVGSDIDRIEVKMPAVAHLNRPNPKDIREARYSAQAVAAISVLYPPVYGSFTDDVIHLADNQGLRQMIERVTLISDKEAPTSLANASIGISAWSGGRQILDSTEDLRQLRPWSVEYAAELLQGRPAGWLPSLYRLPYAQAYALATDRSALLSLATT